MRQSIKPFVLEAVTQILRWSKEIIEHDRTGLSPGRRRSRAKRKAGAFKMMSEIAEVISSECGPQLADDLGKRPYERMVDKLRGETLNRIELFRDIKVILNDAGPPENLPNLAEALVAARNDLRAVLKRADRSRLVEAPHLVFGRTSNLAELLIRMHQWANNIALENPLHLVHGEFSVVAVHELDFPPIRAEDYDNREPRYYIPLHTQPFQWQGLAVTFAEMLPNKRQEIQYHEEREYTTTYGHKVVHYKPNAASIDVESYNEVATRFGETVAIEKLTTHTLENLLSRRNPDFTVKECALQLYKTMGREYPKGGEAGIVPARKSTNDESGTRGWVTNLAQRVKLEPNDDNPHDIVQELYEIDQGAALMLDLNDSPELFFRGYFVIAVLPYPSNFTKTNDWSMVRQGDRYVEFNTPLLSRLTATVCLDSHDPAIVPGGSLIVLRQGVENITITNTSTFENELTLVVLLARPVLVQ